MKMAKLITGMVFVGILTLGVADNITLAQDLREQLTNESVLTAIKKRGALNVGHGSFVPWAFRSTKGEYVGFEIDIGKKLAEDMGVKYNSVPTAWDGIIPALLAGKFDIIISGMSPSPKRALTVSFTDSYSLPLQQGFVTNTKLSSGMAKMEDYNKPSVQIVSRRGGMGEVTAKKNLPKATHRLFDDDAMAFQEVLNGNAHGIFGQEPKPQFWMLEFSDQVTKPFGKREFSEEPGASAAVRQGDTVMLTYVNNWINWRTGFIREHFEYWFTTDGWFGLDPKRAKK